MNFQKARFITKNDKDALRQLYGFIFGDGKLCVYEYRSFGKTNYNRKLTPILNRGVYHYQHGARQNEPYAKERFANKVECVFPMVAVSILPQAEFGPNDHLEHAPILQRCIFFVSIKINIKSE